MRLTLDALVVLDAIERVGSFAGAADRLHRVPSAVSYTVHKLEQDLGVLLFDRSGHRAKLTAAGARLLKEGRELLRVAGEVERRVREVGTGCEACLTIAVADVVERGAVYPMLGAFYDAPGHEGTRLQLRAETQATCWEALVDGRSDLVIGAPEPGPAVDGVHTQPLGEIALSLVVPAAHPLAWAEEPLPGSALIPYRVVASASMARDGAAGQTRDELMMVDSFASQLDAIRHGLGIGYAPPYLVCDDVASGRLVTKRVACAPTLRVAAAWRETPVGRGLRWFLDRLGDAGVRARLVPPAAPARATTPPRA